MLLQHLQLFGILSRLQYHLHIVLLCWDPLQRRAYLVKGDSKDYRRTFRSCTLHTLTTVVIILQGIFSANSTNHFVTSVDKYLYGFIVSIQIPITFLMWSSFRLAPVIRIFVNGMIEFAESHCCGGQKDHGHRKHQNFFRTLSPVEKLNILLAYAQFPACFAVMLVYLYGLHWHSPCKPSLVGYYLLPECRESNRRQFSLNGHIICHLLSLFLKVLVFMINQWFWILAMTVASHVLSQLQILCTLTIRGFIYVFHRKMQQSETLFEMEEAVRTYRIVQILSQLASESVGDVVLNAVIVANILLQSFSLTAFIWMPWNLDNLIWLMMYAVNCFMSSCILLVTEEGLANLLQESRNTMCALNKGLIFETKYFRKRKRIYYRSFALIKIRFGMLNFIDRLTPLRSVDVANNVAVQLLLLGTPSV